MGEVRPDRVFAQAPSVSVQVASEHKLPTPNGVLSPVAEDRLNTIDGTRVQIPQVTLPTLPSDIFSEILPTPNWLLDRDPTNLIFWKNDIRWLEMKPLAERAFDGMNKSTEALGLQLGKLFELELRGDYQLIEPAARDALQRYSEFRASTLAWISCVFSAKYGSKKGAELANKIFSEKIPEINLDGELTDNALLLVIESIQKMGEEIALGEITFQVEREREFLNSLTWVIESKQQLEDEEAKETAELHLDSGERGSLFMATILAKNDGLSNSSMGPFEFARRITRPKFSSSQFEARINNLRGMISAIEMELSKRDFLKAHDLYARYYKVSHELNRTRHYANEMIDYRVGEAAILASRDILVGCIVASAAGAYLATIAEGASQLSELGSTSRLAWGLRTLAGGAAFAVGTNLVTGNWWDKDLSTIENVGLYTLDIIGFAIMRGLLGGVSKLTRQGLRVTTFRPVAIENLTRRGIETSEEAIFREMMDIKRGGFARAVIGGASLVAETGALGVLGMAEEYASQVASGVLEGEKDIRRVISPSGVVSSNLLSFDYWFRTGLAAGAMKVGNFLALPAVRTMHTARHPVISPRLESQMLALTKRLEGLKAEEPPSRGELVDVFKSIRRVADAYINHINFLPATHEARNSLGLYLSARTYADAELSELRTEKNYMRAVGRLAARMKVAADHATQTASHRFHYWLNTEAPHANLYGGFPLPLFILEALRDLIKLRTDGFIGREIKIDDRVYRVRRYLDKGTAGIVYLADGADGGRYAIKSVQADTMDWTGMGRKSQDFLARLHIPVPRLIACDPTRGLLVTEYVEGKNMMEVIAAGEVTRDDILKLYDMSVKARAAAINLDWYPKNFVKTPDGTIVYVDDGINVYKERWSFEKFGVFFFANTEGMREYMRSGDFRHVTGGGFDPVMTPKVRERVILWRFATQ